MADVEFVGPFLVEQDRSCLGTDVGLPRSQAAEKVTLPKDVESRRSATQGGLGPEGGGWALAAVVQSQKDKDDPSFTKSGELRSESGVRVPGAEGSRPRV